MNTLCKAQLFHHQLIKADSSVYVWQQESSILFDELIISWNALRPKRGEYHLYVSVKFEEWTPWIKYSAWGHDFQETYQDKLQDGTLSTFQDTILINNQKKPSQFKIKVEASRGVSLEDFHHLYACASEKSVNNCVSAFSKSDSVEIQLRGVSQMALIHPRSRSLCSPTSLTAVVRHFLQNDGVDPAAFANQVWDRKFDIYGNWVLNTAQAFVEMGEKYRCWVQRLEGFGDILESLHKGYPVVVSVKGPLRGSALPYDEGHLIVVHGFDAMKKNVLCMDPAFLEDEKTNVRYDLGDFTQAWGRRGNVAYLFRDSV